MPWAIAFFILLAIFLLISFSSLRSHEANRQYGILCISIFVLTARRLAPFDFDSECTDPYYGEFTKGTHTVSVIFDIRERKFELRTAHQNIQKPIYSEGRMVTKTFTGPDWAGLVEEQLPSGVTEAQAQKIRQACNTLLNEFIQTFLTSNTGAA